MTVAELRDYITRRKNLNSKRGKNACTRSRIRIENISTLDFPVELYGAVDANLEGTSVVCGGYGSTGYSDKCYRFKNSVWEEFVTFSVTPFLYFKLNKKHFLSLIYLSTLQNSIELLKL